MDTWTEIIDDVLIRGGDLLIRAGAATIVAAVLIGVGLAFAPLVKRRLRRHGRPSRTSVFTALYRVLVVLIGVLLSITLAFPSVRVVDVLASLGVISVAVGFAFKDVLENLLAGVLLLVRDPFKSGDQIRVAGYEGTVEGITVRETLLRTHDGERVLIPNAQVYTGALEVSTHFPTSRVSFRLLVDAAADPDAIRRAVGDALESSAPDGAAPPEVIMIGADRGALEVEVRVWTASDRGSRVATLDHAVPAVLRALRDAGIALDEPRAVIVEGSED